MAEYIERTEELILAVNAGARAIENTKRYHGSSYCLNVFSNDHKEIPYLKAAEVLRGFDEIPSADVAPVRHAKWIMRGGKFRCSYCDAKANWEDTGGTGGFSHEYQQVRSEFCHHCGARMDLEET